MESALAGRTLAHYAILEKLAEGGMGVVYRARDLSLDRPVAIKVLRPDHADPISAARLVREARAAARLNHPNIVTVYAVQEVDGILLFVMELVEGTRLDHLLPAGGFPLGEALGMAAALADALWAAHQRGLVHRDIKPANLILGSDGRLRVLDFGLVRPPIGTEALEEGAALTVPGLVLGTLAYMSPEQLRGETTDHRSDIFSFGIVLHEWVTGRHPFPAANPVQVMTGILRDDPTSPGELRDGVPPMLDRIVGRCLARNPDDRYASARDLRDDLDACLHGVDGIDRPPRPAAAPSGELQAIEAWRHQRIDEWTRACHRLDREFVAMSMLVDQGEETASGRWSARAERFDDLADLLTAVDDPVLVLLGAPGSGKSTLLRRLELDMARRGLRDPAAPLTFLLPLNQYRPDGVDGVPVEPMAWLAERWSARNPRLPALGELMREGRIILLLDALNEMPVAGPAALHDAVLRWRDFIERLADHPGCRVVFSCRALDYSAPLSTPRLRVPQVVVEPLTDDRVEQFLLKYCGERGADIWGAIRGTPQLALMRSPYFLSLLAGQVEARGALPHGRAALFTGFVRQSLRREVESGNPLFRPDGLLTDRDVRRITQWSWQDHWQLPDRGHLLRHLSRLAYVMQERGGGGGQVRIGYDEALAVLDHEQDESILKAGLALSILDEDPVTDEILYVHQLVQEYFAGRELARNPDPVRLRAPWRSRDLRRPLVEVIGELPPGESLPPLETTGWEETALLGAAMAADPDAYVRLLMEANLVLAGRSAGQAEVMARLSPALLDDLRAALLARSRDPEADLRVRLAASQAMGDLGDPRFTERAGPHGAWLEPPTAVLPAGRYPIGEDDLFEYLGHRIEAHRPRHEVTVEAVALGRFPVTNAEWARFMAAGGYDDERWWPTVDARRWRSGEGTADGTHANVRYWLEQFQSDINRLESAWTNGQMPEESYLRWKRRLGMTPDEFDAHLRELYPGGRLTAPAFWTDARFTHPLQPVVGVSWYEALAYCAWLSVQSGQAWRLPTEVEWEAAARGPGARAYAWGDAFEPLRANTAAAKIQGTSPVGIFVEGDTPEGLSDMTGNVEEWTGSMFGAGMDFESAPCGYPYVAGDGREDPESGSHIRRVLRGGGWNSDPVNARTAYRLEYHAGHRFFVNGFRLARAIPA